MFDDPMTESVMNEARRIARSFNIYHFDRAEDAGWEQHTECARAVLAERQRCADIVLVNEPYAGPAVHDIAREILSPPQ